MGLFFSEKDVKIYSVDEITTHIKNLLEKNNLLQNVRVRGEISNFLHHNSGHMYFDLKDENSIIRCVFFRNVNNQLKFKPEDGAEVIVNGQIDVYKKRGTYGIIVKEMELAGEGTLFKQFLKLKEKLEKEGLFKEKFKKPIPQIPRKIGIVTSLEGAAVRDIIKTIKKRFPHVTLIIYPSLVQGDEAKYQIVRGIEVLNQLNLDIIIVARGGGSFEDLWSFNEETVARAIFKSKIPIITGIGHEIDFTIADFVADKRAHTPSAAAELAVPNILEINNILSNFKKLLYKDLRKIRENYTQRIKSIKERSVFKRPHILIEQYLQIIDGEKEQIIKIFMNENEIFKKDLEIFKEKINAFNPKAILKRGYSITMFGTEIIKSVKTIKSNDIILTVLGDGELKSKIE